MLRTELYGYVCFLVAIIIMALTLLVLFVPSANIAIPSVLVGVGTIVAVIALGVGLFLPGTKP